MQRVDERAEDPERRDRRARRQQHAGSQAGGTGQAAEVGAKFHRIGS